MCKTNKFDPIWALVKIVKQNNSIEVINASLSILPDAEGFKTDSEQEKAKNLPSGYSHNSHNSDYSDFMSEVSTFPCLGIVHVNQCEETEVDQNIYLNNTEQADVDGDEHLNMDKEEEEQNCPFCQKVF